MSHKIFEVKNTTTDENFMANSICLKNNKKYTDEKEFFLPDLLVAAVLFGIM